MQIGKTIKKFMHLESSSGIVLFAMAVFALIIDNSPIRHYYHNLLELNFTIQIGPLILVKPVLLWINEGLMTIFFLVIGLEIKREMLEGELNNFSKASLPAVAALGGMLLPAVIYSLINWKNPEALSGWAIPTATDIAFSLGIVSLLGPRVPSALKIFLMALAIFDDMGGITIIALFYTQDLSHMLLLLALGLTVILICMNRFRLKQRWPYFFVGILLWLCVLKSGVHATLSGIILAFAIPMHRKNEVHRHKYSLEEKLHPWVAFIILPLFAFANAGISFLNVNFSHFIDTISVGIALGLFLGKQLGIWGITLLAVKLGIVKMPKGISSRGIYGIALVAGVGFTMSLFMGTLAFEHNPQSQLYITLVRMGVLIGSLFSGLLGYIVLHFSYGKQQR